MRLRGMPVVELRDGRVYAVELLCGTSSAALDAATRPQALRQLERLRQEAGLAGAKLALNLRPDEARGGDPCGELKRLLETAPGARPEDLVVEISERALEGACPGRVMRRLRRLKEAGFEVWLDDAELAAGLVWTLAGGCIHGVKLGRGMLRLGLRPTAAGRRVRRLTAVLAGALRRLGIKLVLEGVETPAEEALARGLGAHYAQGLLYGMISLGEAAAWKGPGQ